MRQKFIIHFQYYKEDDGDYYRFEWNVPGIGAFLVRMHVALH